MKSDYVIVGAGPAGCVLARRLTEDADVTVTLVEAGGADRDLRFHIPAAFAELFGSVHDWNYETTPQPSVGDRSHYWPRGKVLGGCSSLNAMIYMRGHPDDYDGWAGEASAEWSFDRVLPYFKLSEAHHAGPSSHHGGDGPLNVSRLRNVHPASTAFVSSAAAVGMRRTADFNGREHGGCGEYEVTQRGGKRHSAWRAFVWPVRRRPNLTVLKHSFVTAVRFDGQRKATGVQVVAAGRTFELPAAREVILCCGAINSPQLLMLSGVGPADHLRALDIDVVVDSPWVGRNLHDHLAVPVVFAMRGHSLARLDRLAGIVVELGKYLVFKRGLLTSNVAEAGGFVNTRDESRVPDIQFHFAPGYFRHHGTLKASGDHFSIGTTLVRPESRGTIRLRTADPADKPVIDPQYCVDPRDRASLVAGLRIARRIAAVAPLRDFAAAEILPGAAADDRTALEEHIAREAQTLYHPVGTCRMAGGRDGVVDARLQVRGVRGIRVVDASIMPTIVCGNTQAPTMMIAERAADWIRGRSG